MSPCCKGLLRRAVVVASVLLLSGCSCGGTSHVQVDAAGAMDSSSDRVAPNDGNYAMDARLDVPRRHDAEDMMDAPRDRDDAPDGPRRDGSLDALADASNDGGLTQCGPFSYSGTLRCSEEKPFCCEDPEVLVPFFACCSEPESCPWRDGDAPMRCTERPVPPSEEHPCETHTDCPPGLTYCCRFEDRDGEVTTVCADHVLLGWSCAGPDGGV